MEVRDSVAKPNRGPSSGNAFTAYCRNYGSRGAKATESWGQLDDGEKKEKRGKKGGALVAHRNSTDVADLSSLLDGDVVGPLGSSEEHLPFAVDNGRSLATEGESSLAHNRIIVGESIPFISNNGLGRLLKAPY